MEDCRAIDTYAHWGNQRRQFLVILYHGYRDDGKFMDVEREKQ